MLTLDLKIKDSDIIYTSGVASSEVRVGTEGLRGPGAEPRWRSGGEARSPQKPDMTVRSCQCVSVQVCCRVRPQSPLPPKNFSDLRESHDPTRLGQGGHVTCPPLATL